MNKSQKLKSKTYFITGASRGIGRAIAKKLASHGANIAIAAKTDEPHPKLSGTIHSVAKEVEELGGQAFAIKLDIRNEEDVISAVEKTAEKFGGIDAVINNASAIFALNTEDLSFKNYDLMHDINVRGTFTCVKAALPYLKQAKDAHILTLSPPINMTSVHLGLAPAYGTSKYGMSIMTLGFAKEFEGQGIHANTLWPVTTIDTAAIRVHFPDLVKHSRTSQIVADAAFAILHQIKPSPTGQSFTDESALKAIGIKDFSEYAVDPDQNLTEDFYIS